ncbi:MAG TPA: hypothetical protein VGN20_02070 [Mucilaginibacter sp.]|jgi:hypothetical protein
MKKNLISFLVLLCLFYSCKSDQQKAENKVKSFLDSSLNDPNGYQSVKFDSLKRVFQTYELTKEGIELMRKFYFYNDRETKDLKLMGDNITSVYNGAETFKRYEIQRDSLKKVSVYDTKMADSLYKLYNKNKSSFKSNTIDHYILTHLYRAKNKYGALQLQASEFFIKDLNNGFVRIDTTVYNEEK